MYCCVCKLFFATTHPWNDQHSYKIFASFLPYFPPNLDSFFYLIHNLRTIWHAYVKIFNKDFFKNWEFYSNLWCNSFDKNIVFICISRFELDICPVDVMSWFIHPVLSCHFSAKSLTTAGSALNSRVGI